MFSSPLVNLYTRDIEAGLKQSHEPAKWVAKLRATADGGAPGQVLFRAELGTAGHTGPAGRYDRLGYQAEIGAFIVAAAG